MAELVKDPTILRLLGELRGRLGVHAFDVFDRWECDLCAVGIASPRDHGVLVYLATWNRGPGRYDVELELPAESGSDLPYQEAGAFRDVDFETVMRIVGEHLGRA
jgi:hypothetical protein